MTNAVQTPTPAARPATAWDLDPAHSSAAFSVKHLMIATVRGRMAVTKGSIEWDGEDLASAKVVAELDTASIDTSAADRDKHLRSPDFLDAERHPALRFESTAVRALGDDAYEVDGLLAIRGEARPVTLRASKEGEAVDPWGGRRVALSAKATLDRREWGLTWNMALEAGGFLVGDTVKVELDVQAVERRQE